MTFQFLSQSPNSAETKEKISEILTQNKDGRMFVLTGNVSAQKNDLAAQILLSFIEWAAANKDRELVIWAGIWVDFKALSKAKEGFEKENPGGRFICVEDRYLTTEKVASDLASLYLQAERSYIERKPESPVIYPTIQFFGIKKWHAKAIGLTGKGEDFKRTHCAIFGSTNFSANALGGKSFELDLYMDRETQEGCVLLDNFTNKMGLLMDEARERELVPNFQELVFQKIDAIGSKNKGI